MGLEMSVDKAMRAIACPYCGSDRSTPWAEERGYVVVRCDVCDFLYVNPAPPVEAISDAVRTGFHGSEAGNLDVRSRRVAAKVDLYERLLREMFSDIWSRNEPIRWLDVGAGYGEVVEAIQRLAPPGSMIEGLEPMEPKAAAGRARGLAITQDYLRRDHERVGFVSSIDVFSHIPDYRSFLSDVRAVLEPAGEMFIVTGNLADLATRQEFFDELGTPDHLVFAGRKHIVGYLEEAGFEVVRIKEMRLDGLVNTAKMIVKKLIGRPGLIRLPYSSTYRQLAVRARLAA